MCGIVGYIRKKGMVNRLLFESMIDLLAHRGPDGRGSHYNPKGNIAFGHRRLSFLDLGENGKQPFLNQDGSIWLSFNGEIYNYRELKQELKSQFEFRTQTDTEVLLAAYEVWGVEFINKIKGMFAFALYDDKKKKLYLARDRFGIKPLYYGISDQNDLVFASELKSILASKIFPRKIDYSSFCDYFVYRYIPSPKTIWQGIKKLPPAHFLEVDLENFNTKLTEYWKLKSAEQDLELSEMVSEVKEKIKLSVSEHLRSDVEIGTFLSGGYDSSGLAAFMTAGDKKPNAFSIGFKDWSKSEHHYAELVANHLSMIIDSTIVDSKSLNEIEIMPQVYDEPIADISIIPTYLVSALARKKNKAVFSGEGADELFGGYTWQHDYFKKKYPTNILQKFKNSLKGSDDIEYYANSMAMGYFDQGELKQMLRPEYHQFIPKDVHWFYRQHLKPNLTPMKRVQFLDIKCFMGELVLTKIDRASMANSIEVRVPFLDHQIAETVFSFPELKYIDPNQTKKLLFECIKDLLPNQVLNRKKQGFVGPDDYYMDQSFYRNLLLNSKLVEFGVIKAEYVEQLLSKDYDWKLWKIAVMEKWFKQWIAEN